MTRDLGSSTSTKNPFPGFIQFVVLLSLLPVVYNGAIFELFGTIDLSFRYFPLDTIEKNRDFATHLPSIFHREELESYVLSFLAMGLLYPFAVVVAIVKRRWGWLICGLAMSHVVVALTLGRLLAAGSLPDQDAWEFYLKDYVQPVSYISLAWFLMVGRLWSKCFILFCLLCLAMHMGFTRVSQNESVLLILFAPLAMLIMFSVVGKAFYYGLFQNLYLFKRVGVIRTFWVGLKALFYWSPMLILVIIPLLGLSLWIHHEMTSALYWTQWSYEDGLTGAEKRAERKAKTEQDIKEINHAISKNREEINVLSSTIDMLQRLLDGLQPSTKFMRPVYDKQLKETKNRKQYLKNKNRDLAAAKQVAEKQYRQQFELEKQFSNLMNTRTQEGDTAYLLIQRKQGFQYNPEVDLPWSANVLINTYYLALSERLLSLEYYLVNLGAKSVTEETVAAAAKQFDQMMPEELGMEGKEYDGFWGRAKTWGSRESAEMVEDGYTKIRDKTRKNLLNKVRSLMTQNVEPTFDQRREQLLTVVENAKTEAFNLFYDMNRSAQASLVWGYRWFEFSQLVGTLLFIFVCIRSYLYVLGRVAFDSSQKIYISLEDIHTEKPDLPKSRVAVFDKEYELKGEDSEKYFFSRKFEPHGYPPKLSIPQLGAAPIGRFRHGCMALNKIAVTEHSNKVFFTGQKSEHFVEWRLEPGEAVVFDYRNFVGMSETIKLSVHISLRVSSLMLDKVIYPVATGPGKLILCTEGVPHFGDDEHTSSSMPANRLVAWQKGLRFHSESELNFVDIYFSDNYVKKAGDGILIMDADKRGSAKNGLTRFIKHFFFP